MDIGKNIPDSPGFYGYIYNAWILAAIYLIILVSMDVYRYLDIGGNIPDSSGFYGYI